MVVAMLSVGSRRSNEGGRFGENGIAQQQGQMEENELEEGETCLYNEFNHFDPDVAFSYIDERLQDVLGHFQKDFEGVVSSETLGSKYGRYGSFLPVHQRSPSVLLQPKTPAIVQHSTQKTSNEGTVERIRSAAASLGNSAFPKKMTSSSTIVPGSAAVAVDMTNKNEMTNNNTRGSKEMSPSKKGSVVKNASVNDQKKFTFRIKVPPDSLQRSKNSAIYSGLGLENSPSSSLEDNPDDRDDVSPSDEYSTDQTPMSIVQIMTSHKIPGGVLLSPMHEDLGKLADGDDQAFPCDAKNRTSKRETHEVPPTNRNEFDLGKDFQGSKEMKGRSDEKHRKYTEVKKEIDMESVKHSTNDLKKDLDFENKMGRELGSSSLKVAVKSTSKDYHYEMPENEIMCDPGKEKSKLSNLAKETVKGTSKEKIMRADIPKDEHKEIDGNIDPRVMKSESGRLMQSSAKLVCTQNELDQMKEEKKVGVHKDTVSETKKSAKETAKHSKKYELSKDLTGYKECNDQKDVKNDMSKDKFTGKLVSDEMTGIHKVNEKNHGSTIKKKQKDTSRKTSSTKDHSKEKSKDFARESYKDLRNEKHSVTSEIYGESMKARKESKPAPVKDQYRDCVKDAGYEQSENRKDSLDGFRKDNMKQSKFDSFERGSSRVPEREKEREQSLTKVAASKKLDHASIADTHVLNAVVTEPLPGGVVGGDAGTGPVPSIVINDEWVQCDACEKWRLLPYGVESSSLPQKWFCRMLDWLPAMNRCDITEEQTTQALRALYLPQPALGPVDASRVQSQLPGAPACAAMPDIKQAEQTNDNKCLRFNSVSGNVKKGQVQRTLLNAPSSTSLPNSLSKKSKQSSIKSKSLNDVVHQPLEQLQGSIGVANQPVKGNEVLAEARKLKQKDKWKLKQNFPDEVGYDTGEGSTHSLKRKSDGEPDTRVKIKKSKDNSSPKGDNKHEFGEGLSVLDKTFKDQNQTSLETDSRGTYSGLDSGKIDRRDFSAKKRKMKEWKQSQSFKEGFLEREYLKDGRTTVIEEESETEHRIEKKVKTLKLEGKESTASKADVQLEKKGKVTRILASSQKDLMSDGLEEQGRDGYEKENEWGQLRPQGVARRVSNGMDTLKRDTGYVQPFVAATSSSSKVSCSLKNFPNFQEVRGSPVESVSSSPMRISKVDKLSLTGRSGLGTEDLIDGNFPCLASPRRFSDGEGDAQSDRTGPVRKTKKSCVEQPGSHESCRGVQSSLLNSRKFDDGDDRDGKDKKAHKMIDHLVNGANVTEHLSQKNEKERFQEKLGERHNSDSCQERKGSREKIIREQDRERAKVALQKKGKDKIQDSISNSHEEFYTLGKDVGRRSQEVAPESHVQSPYHEVSRSSKEIIDDKRTNRVDKDRRNNMDWKGNKKLGEGRRVNPVKHGLDENLEAVPSNFHTKSNRDSISKHPKSGATPRKDVKANSQHSLQQDLSRGGERASNQALSDRNVHPESTTIRDKSQSIQCSGDKRDLQGHGSGGACLGNKGTRMEGAATDATYGEFLRAPRESSRADNSNGALICHSKPPVSNEVSGRDPEGAFSSPNRREHWQAAGNFIKEAKDLKHKGDNIKNKGDTELESTALYFNAALKFLKGASLLEPFNAENTRPGEKTQSMAIYTDTAKLCEYCAVTYERNKQMAAAALAYKCMGVAHMRVVISKNSSISRDRHELQTAFENALPGESPSSSASDVDNLNNHALMDKSSNPAKVAGSAQVAGDHIIVARHRPLYQRVLQYTNDTISAIEAFRKSDYAFSAVNGSLDGANYQSAAISAVKRVMDFNFHDMDTLLHLVKFALEALYH